MVKEFGRVMKKKKQEKSYATMVASEICYVAAALRMVLFFLLLMPRGYN
jgi:hypothetical protein